MEFSNEFIEQNQLTPEQVSAISNDYKSQFNTELGKQVHENTENNLGRIWETVNKTTGIDREQGEKYADALTRASSLFFEGQKSDLTRQKEELEKKLQNAEGDESLKAQLGEYKNTVDALKQKEAEYDDWVKNDYKGKYEQASTTLNQMQQRIAFKDNMPQRPETVNKYEWDAKIKEFQTQLLEENNLVFDGDTAWIVNKDNEFKKNKLSDAVSNNKVIQELAKGRSVTGLGSKQTKEVTIDGVPFKVPENATPRQRQDAIKEYLQIKGIDPITSPEYPKMYSELNTKILQKG